MFSGISAHIPVQAISTTSEIKRHQKLPNEIIRDGQYIITDLDGTILHTFNPEKQYEPGLDESPCHKPLLEWLGSGGRVAAITGNDLTRTIERFFNHIPKELRRNNQVIIIANGGSAFYGTDPEGNLVEDTDYREHGLFGDPTIIAPDHVDQLVSGGIDIINNFFSELIANPKLLDNLPKKFPFLHEIANGRTTQTNIDGVTTKEFRLFTAEELLTHDTSVVPRIEKRCIVDVNLDTNPGLVTQIALIGVPSLLEYPLEQLFSDGTDSVSLGLSIKRENLTTEVNRENMNKAVSVFWMNSSKKYDFNPEKSFSIGDRPNGNDGPLMDLQDTLKMPFISVSEKMENLSSDIFHIGGNCDNSAKLLMALTNKAYKLAEKGEFLPVIPTKLSEVISEL